MIGITISADRMLSKTVILPDDTIYCPVDSPNIHRATYKNQSDDKATIDIWQVKNLKDGTLKTFLLKSTIKTTKTLHYHFCYAVFY